MEVKRKIHCTVKYIWTIPTTIHEKLYGTTEYNQMYSAIQYPSVIVHVVLDKEDKIAIP